MDWLEVNANLARTGLLGDDVAVRLLDDCQRMVADICGRRHWIWREEILEAILIPVEGREGRKGGREMGKRRDWTDGWARLQALRGGRTGESRYQ